MIEAFLRAASDEERLDLVRITPETGERLRAYDLNHGAVSRSGPIEFKSPRESALDAVTNLLLLDYRLGKEDWRTAVLERTPSGLKLDWESFVAYEEVPFPEFMEAADGTSGAYRVSATMADYYNFRYESEGDYLQAQVLVALCQKSRVTNESSEK